MICFHNPDEINGYLSNWYKSDFIVGDIKYSSMEQYMMYSKACLFKDSKTAGKILKTSDVAKIKRLGREVVGFIDATWDRYKVQIVMEGLYAKFTQNPDLCSLLLSTGDEIIAECAVKDKIWGIGLSMTDNRRFDFNSWRGTNLLGQCLMELRSRLR